MSTQEMGESKPQQASVKVGLILQGDMAKKFETIKRRYGLESNADLMRLLVSQKYEEILIRDSSISQMMKAAVAT